MRRLPLISVTKKKKKHKKKKQKKKKKKKKKEDVNKRGKTAPKFGTHTSSEGNFYDFALRH